MRREGKRRDIRNIRQYANADIEALRDAHRGFRSQLPFFDDIECVFTLEGFVADLEIEIARRES